jgi:hypothetical protein
MNTETHIISRIQGVPPSSQREVNDRHVESEVEINDMDVDDVLRTQAGV